MQCFLYMFLVLTGFYFAVFTKIIIIIIIIISAGIKKASRHKIKSKKVLPHHKVSRAHVDRKKNH